jgi:hypothetical protein
LVHACETSMVFWGDLVYFFHWFDARFRQFLDCFQQI